MADNKDNLLVKASAKKAKGFKREYPFPIINNENVEENQEDASWKYIIGHLQENCVHINDVESIQLLYKKGFYGKGTASKNAPQVCQNYPQDLRKRRKKSPAPSRDVSEEDVICVDINDNDSPVSEKYCVVEEDLDVEELSDSNSSEDEISLAVGEGVQQNLPMETESLQLTFEEAFFLSYGLGCLVVKNKEGHLMTLTQAWSKFCQLAADRNFPVMYTAYHHFRSKGWIVKCGLKYGVDYALYKDGPPFYHASYSVVVKPVREQGLKDVRGNRQFTWSDLAALNRINNQAGKGLMFLYVIKPNQVSEHKIATPFCISQYKLEEVIIKRWVPAENREEKD